MKMRRYTDEIMEALNKLGGAARETSIAAREHLGVLEAAATIEHIHKKAHDREKQLRQWRIDNRQKRRNGKL